MSFVLVNLMVGWIWDLFGSGIVVVNLIVGWNNCKTQLHCNDFNYIHVVIEEDINDIWIHVRGSWRLRAVGMPSWKGNP